MTARLPGTDRLPRTPRMRFGRPSISPDFAIGLAIGFALALVIILFVEAFLRIHSVLLG